MLSEICAGLCLCKSPFDRLAELLLLMMHGTLCVRRSKGRLAFQTRFETGMNPEDGTIWAISKLTRMTRSVLSMACSYVSIRSNEIPRRIDRGVLLLRLINWQAILAVFMAVVRTSWSSA